ncbi:MAG: DUF4411 family protein [Cyanobacteria bacterium HKST-UBA02]|nr:DUF4411 family protein [Cyanobacteria bacterium HKST-UBA02]
MYVFDTSALSALFRNYYKQRFPTLWKKFDKLVDDKQIVSTREVFREIDNSSLETLRVWAIANRSLFAVPTAAEAVFVAKIYSVSHFQKNIEQQKLYKGGKNADPFVIARAATESRNVVTMEILKPNGVKIPNICQHFGIVCLTLEGFMEEQGWTF